MKHQINHIMRINYLIILLGTFIIINTGCSDNAADNNGSTGSVDELSLSGTAAGYGGDGHALYPASRFDPLGEGTLEADGTFSVTLWSGTEIESELEELETGFGGFEPFPCMDDDSFEITDPDARFAQVRAILYDDGELSNSIVLNDQTEGEVDRLNPLLAHGEKRVYWIYADRDASIQGTCETSRGNQIEQRMVDLDLTEGWNEIIYDYRNRYDLRMIQGSRPAIVDWYTDWGEE